MAAEEDAVTRRRPFILGFTEGGLLGEKWGTFATPESAWRKADQLLAFWKKKRWGYLYSNHWFVVIGPDYQKCMGIFSQAGNPLPFSEMQIRGEK